MSAAAAASSTARLPIDWAASTSSQGWRGWLLNSSATAAIGITEPVFHSRWESTTSRVRGVRACSTAASAASGSWPWGVLRHNCCTGRGLMVSCSRRASSWQAATTPGCSQSPISTSSPGCQGKPHRGSTQPLVTFSVRLMRCGPTPQAAARLRRTRATSCSMNGHTVVVKGPNSWMRPQLAVIASREGVGSGPWPP